MRSRADLLVRAPRIRPERRVAVTQARPSDELIGTDRSSMSSVVGAEAFGARPCYFGLHLAVDRFQKPQGAFAPQVPGSGPLTQRVAGAAHPMTRYARHRAASVGGCAATPLLRWASLAGAGGGSACYRTSPLGRPDDL
jgi:hypothetical protein